MFPEEMWFVIIVGIQWSLRWHYVGTFQCRSILAIHLGGYEISSVSPLMLKKSDGRQDAETGAKGRQW